MISLYASPIAALPKHWEAILKRSVNGRNLPAQNKRTEKRNEI